MNLDSAVLTGIEARVIRLESKLTRMMLGLGMDNEGNPAGGSLVVDKALVERVLDALENYLALCEAPPDTYEEVTKVVEAEGLYEQLRSIRNGRWPAG